MTIDPFDKAGPRFYIKDIYPKFKIPLLWHEDAVMTLQKIEKESRDELSKLMAANALKKLQSVKNNNSGIQN